ncbi:MaoC family dehydratase [Mesorhizobium sp. B3-1-6]|uniref:MaoC family dehydratase n=1 Tax=Mesorhizobium sp. B3-1-6 TaxID=2589895 RepID=UPI001126A638|nr:MaoC family dehydratase [Mesorhizobium sp. B3-1-6]TPI44370.1 MaoC family dehydratase [Mesorhizobium sp. B3-1-6]
MAKVHSARDERFGGYLDDYRTGDVFEHWPGKTITEADNHLFCLLTMAASPLHIDRRFAETEMAEGRNIVVGTYIYSLLLGMSVPDISGRAIANLGVSELRHLKPLFHGDTLYGQTEILETRPSASRPGEGILTVRTDGFNQDRAKVCTFTRAVLLPMRAGRPAGRARTASAAAET